MFHFIIAFNGRLIFNLRLDNCSISRIRFNSNPWSVISINDAYHTFEIGDVTRETDSPNISP